MATPLYGSPNFATTINVGGGIDNSQTTGIVLTSVSGLNTGGGILGIDWATTIDASTYEEIEYGGVSGNELTGVIRGVNGFSAKSHLNGATIVSVISSIHNNRIADKLRSVDATLSQDPNGNEIIKTGYNASAVNEVTVTNAATGNNPQISTTGGDSAVGLDIKMKSTGRFRRPTVVELPIGSATASLATGDGQAFFRVPSELNGMNLTGVAAQVYVAGTTNTLDVQIHRTRSATPTDMLSTKITIDSTEVDTSTAAAAAVIDTGNDDVATGDLIAIDIDAVHSTPAKGLIVEMRFELP